jgi:hypothetical protein
MVTRREYDNVFCWHRGQDSGGRRVTMSCMSSSKRKGRGSAAWHLEFPNVVYLTDK